MQINLTTNQLLEINNNRATILSIDPEAPSLITTLVVQYIDGPLQGQTHNIRLFN